MIQLNECKKFNTFISKVIGVVLNSDRTACINRIKEKGYEVFASEMADSKRQTMARR